MMNYIEPHWPAPASIKAYTTTRHGWGERDHSKTQTTYHPTHPDENQKLMTLLNLPEPPLWLIQTHGNTVVEAIPENREKNADASFAAQPHQICTVLTADCLPILICNKQGTQVAAVHAGWRGLAKGIIETTVAALHQPATELLIWLGPAIGPQKFEVGIDVYEAFTEQHSESKAAFIPHHKDKWLANLYTLAKIRLQAQGINNIYGGQFCTFTQADLFFSYRRDHGKTGRMASLIWIEQEKKI